MIFTNMICQFRSQTVKTDAFVIDTQNVEKQKDGGSAKLAMVFCITSKTNYRYR